MNDDISLPNDDEIGERVIDFSAKYLKPMMQEAGKNDEDGLFAVLAMMETSFEVLQANMETEEGAIDSFEELAATYVRNWREQLEKKK